MAQWNNKTSRTTTLKNTDQEDVINFMTVTAIKMQKVEEDAVREKNKVI